MPIPLEQQLARISEQRVPCWLDAWPHGLRLLRKHRPPPWDKIGELVAFHRQLQALVKSDVVTIDVADFYHCWLQTHPALVGAMGEKRRLGYALRTLLADAAARAQLLDATSALRDSYPDQPLMLALPAPRRWAGLAHCRASGAATVDVSWDDAESASMYVADFLRAFSEQGLSGLLLADEAGRGPASDADLARYQPVLNIAGHYRWRVAVLGCGDGYLPGESQAAVEIIAPGCEGSGAGALLPDAFWSAGVAPDTPAPRFWYTTIPADALPETVLERLAALTGRGA